MKRLLLIVGIVCVIAGILSLAFAALNLSMYRNVRDGSAEMYGRFHQRMILFFAVGIVLVLIGAVCLIIRAKLQSTI